MNPGNASFPLGMQISSLHHVQRGSSDNVSSNRDARPQTSPDTSNQALGSSSTQNDTLPEEDVHVQTLYRMVDEQTPTSLIMPTVNSNSSQGQHLIEYYDRLNSISFLSEALGNLQRRRLIQIDLTGRGSESIKQRELAELESTDLVYLETKRVFEIPPKEAGMCDLCLMYCH